MSKYKIVTLIGSTKFKDDFIKVKEQLTLQGFIVLSLGVFSQYDNIKLSEDQLNMLADIQNKKIEMADEIFVINKEASKRFFLGSKLSKCPLIESKWLYWR